MQTYVVLVVLLSFALLGCGVGGDTTPAERVDHSGAAGPSDPIAGDAAPTPPGPLAVQVHYEHHRDGVAVLKITLADDASFHVVETEPVRGASWETELKPPQAEAILESCHWELMQMLANASPSSPHGEYESITVRFADGEELTCAWGKDDAPPTDFVAITRTLIQLAQRARAQQ